VREARITLRGAKVGAAKATVLNSDDIHAHNTFEDQNAVHSREAAIRVAAGEVQFRFPPASVAKLEIELS
jgi:alpha-L-arabinofuranosidase